MNRRLARWVWVPVLVAVVACAEEKADFTDAWKNTVSKVTTDRTYFRDAQGRYVYFNGVNLGGDTKVPCRYRMNKGDADWTWDCAKTRDVPYWDTAMAYDVSYVGRPFPLADADKWFGQLERLGINSVRFIMNWDAIEHAGPGQYDTEYLDFVEALVKKAAEHGIYCLMDMHQDAFSRYLNVRFTSQPKCGSPLQACGEPGSIKWTLLSLVPHDADGKPARVGSEGAMYDDITAGHGAPKWVVQTCLPEKNLDSPYWGVYKPLTFLAKNVMGIKDLLDKTGLLTSLAGSGGTPGPGDDDKNHNGLPDWVDLLIGALPTVGTMDYTDTTDFMPWTFWGVNNALSVDLDRCMGAFFAGNKIWPGWKVDPDTGVKVATGGENIQEFYQRHYTNAWLQVVERVKDEPNVVGYDIMNEPPGIFIMLTAIAAYFQFGLDSVVHDVLVSLLQQQTTAADGTVTTDTKLADEIYTLITSLGLIPPDTSDETKKQWGFEGADLFGMLDINWAFDANYLQKLYERVGTAIQKADPGAIVWFERGASPSMLSGPGGYGQWEVTMTWPRNTDVAADDVGNADYYLRQAVYAPHWYPDIYPFLGLNVMPRLFTAREQRFKEYEAKLASGAGWATYSLGNPPVVYGEFGTYFNYNVPRLPGVTNDDLKAQYQELSYPIAAEILDNYYESFERMFLPRMVWCFSAQNDYRYGDLWDHEDFSIVDPEGNPRAESAWSRPVVRAMSGKPIATHFYSDHHYFDPDKGVVDPVHEFVVEFASKETDAPTEIAIPEHQYPDGFYVWLSDGAAAFDWDRRVLFWTPTHDTPGWVHRARLLPPLAGETNDGWSYFFKDGHVLVGTQTM